jgi:8-oxo-dGTP pyrophosphatase MutT (NUDIX family)
VTEPLAVVRDVRFADGTSAVVELYVSPVPAPETDVFAAMVFVRDAAGDFALVHSVRRQEWGAPGGWREGSESVRHNATREVEEETGIRLDPSTLVAVGHERFVRQAGDGQAGDGLWRPGQDVLQAFRADLTETGPVLRPALDDTSAHEWVSWAEFEHRCGHLFWWPLAVAVFR